MLLNYQTWELCRFSMNIFLYFFNAKHPLNGKCKEPCHLGLPHMGFHGVRPQMLMAHFSSAGLLIHSVSRISSLLLKRYLGTITIHKDFWIGRSTAKNSFFFRFHLRRMYLQGLSVGVFLLNYFSI